MGELAMAALGGSIPGMSATTGGGAIAPKSAAQSGDIGGGNLLGSGGDTFNIGAQNPNAAKASSGLSPVEMLIAIAVLAGGGLLLYKAA